MNSDAAALVATSESWDTLQSILVCATSLKMTRVWQLALQSFNKRFVPCSLCLYGCMDVHMTTTHDDLHVTLGYYFTTAIMITPEDAMVVNLYLGRPCSNENRFQFVNYVSRKLNLCP